MLHLRPRLRRPLPSVALFAAFLGACGDDAAGSADFEPRTEPGSDTGDVGADFGNDNDGFDETALRLTAPTSSRNFVFIANTSNGTLAKVAVQGDSIVISTVRVGALPSEVRTTPESDVAVVLNRGSDTISIVRAGPIGGVDVVETVDAIADANQLVLSPDGQWAFVWYNNQRASAGDRPGSLSEVSAIRIVEGAVEAFQLSVGVNVREIQFVDSTDSAYVISDDGVSVVKLAELSDDRYVAPVAVSSTGVPGAEREVLVTADGLRAVVREADTTSLGVVNLGDGARRLIEFDTNPTDVDLLPDGRRVLISLGSDDAVALLDLDLFAADDLLALRRIDISAHSAGATVLSADGATAFVYDRLGGESVPLASLVDLNTADVTTLNLRKGVRGAAFSPGSDRAIVTHTRAPGEPVAGEPEADIIAKSFAFSVVAADGTLTKLIRIGADVDEVAFSEDGAQAFVLVADEARASRSLWWVNLDTLQTRELSFSRLPEHVGLVPGSGLVWVSQVHALGRIAFINIETGVIREITGFELNGFIE